ncbi:MAG: MFS transporter [Caldilineaceae bacterium]|nr:MFS transporter [Caldilineaceae bacterium]
MTKPVSQAPYGEPAPSSPAAVESEPVTEPHTAPATAPATARHHWDGRKILIGLMVPMGMTILNLSMFGVALPYIRDTFDAQPDVVAWLVTAYTLPFVMFMPFYGRMGDGLGKRRLFLIGIGVFFIGTLICLQSEELWVLMVGRFVQGMGTAGVNPLCISIISDLFPAKERGRALGTWSSTGPAIGMVGPFLAGFLIEGWGWQTIFIPGLIAAPIALYVVRGQLPALRSFSQPDFVRKFDWIGMLFLGGATTCFVAYLSSRAITGIEPLHDWRLLLGAMAFGFAFVHWERRHANPLATLGIYRQGNFGRASYVAGVRMFTMSGISFLVPLYLADVYDLSASAMG